MQSNSSWNDQTSLWLLRCYRCTCGDTSFPFTENKQVISLMSFTTWTKNIIPINDYDKIHANKLNRQIIINYKTCITLNFVYNGKKRLQQVLEINQKTECGLFVKGTLTFNEKIVFINFFYIFDDHMWIWALMIVTINCCNIDCRNYITFI